MTPCKNIRILSLFDDSDLGWSREMLLRNAGYEVGSLPTDTGLSDALAGYFEHECVAKKMISSPDSGMDGVGLH